MNWFFFLNKEGVNCPRTQPPPSTFHILEIRKITFFRRQLQTILGPKIQRRLGLPRSHTNTHACARARAKYFTYAQACKDTSKHKCTHAPHEPKIAHPHTPQVRLSSWCGGAKSCGSQTENSGTAKSRTPTQRNATNDSDCSLKTSLVRGRKRAWRGCLWALSNTNCW